MTSGFNTCPHAGGNIFGLSLDDLVLWFQYMPPRGGQLSACLLMTLSCGFNTCPHAGGNHLSQSVLSLPVRFNTCPHAGGNRFRDCSWHKVYVSIHAPTRGATTVIMTLLKSLVFQYMPPRGGQRFVAVASGHGIGFQYMPPRGGQRLRSIIDINCNSFNTCPHAGGNVIYTSDFLLDRWFQYMPPRGGQLSLVSFPSS